jgi:hypothetical protein
MDAEDVQAAIDADAENQKRWDEGRERCARNLSIQRAEAKHSRRMRALFNNPKLHGRI